MPVGQGATDPVCVVVMDMDDLNVVVTFFVGVDGTATCNEHRRRRHRRGRIRRYSLS